MSAPHPAHGSEGDALHSHGDTHGHGTRGGYIAGFLLSVVLTVIPFWLVMSHAVTNLGIVAVLIFGLAIVQIVVHVRYFLHVDSKAEGGWTLMSFGFTVLIVGIMLSGSIWVMYHLNANLMPSAPMDISSAP